MRIDVHSRVKNLKQCLHCKKDFELTVELITLKCNCYCGVACRDAHKAKWKEFFGRQDAERLLL